MIRTSHIQKQLNVSRFFIRMIERGDRKTFNIPLAILIAEKNGKRPAEYLNVKIRKMAIEINPDLNRKRSSKS